MGHSINNVNSPGSVNSINQKGDNFVINFNLARESTVTVTGQEVVEKDGSYRYQFILEVLGELPIPEIRIEAYSDTERSLYVRQINVPVQLGMAGKRENYDFETIVGNPGSYKVELTVPKKNNVRFELVY